MRRIPPLNSVRAFEAVARHRSFSAAADELSVTVAAVSHQVRQLEDGLGQKLLERGRQVRLTPVGSLLYPQLRDGFDQIAQAFALVKPPAQGDAVQLSTTRAFAERWLMPRLAQFNALHPHIVVHVHASEKPVDLRAEAIDLAIRYGPADDAGAERALLQDHFIAVADTRICPPQRAATIDDFYGRPLLAFKWKNLGLAAPTWSAWLAQAGSAREFSISWYSEETLALHAAERGLGPLLCSSLLVDEALRDGRMQRVQGPALAGFAYRLVEPNASQPRRSLSLFKDWLVAQASASQQLTAEP
ncbi:LysR substrate-binding domain-containing protein [Pseudomonas sp. NPDC077186]|uniref:LysR substrate-binding domain-containing protein n=1 Tax=Pseudomonas sp. NPDC077186 TaxID=3364421 RepID=UPI0037C9F833